MKPFIVFFCLVTSVCFANHPPIRISAANSGADNPPLLTVQNYSFTIKEKELGVEIRLGKEDVKKFSEISRRYLGKNLTFAVGTSVVSFPKMKDVIGGGKLWLTFSDLQSLQTIKRALSEGQMPQ